MGKNIHMKKIILFTILWVSFNSGILSAQDKPVVASTASMIWDMSKNIGGDHFEHRMIVPIGGDPHIYEPTPSDARLVASADLILKNGLTFEGWINSLIKNSGTKASVVTVTEGLPALTSLTYKDASDPHAWMDATKGEFYLRNIRDALIALSPEHKDDIIKNYESYSRKLSELDEYIENEIKKIPEAQRILITSHDAFQYYGRRYGLNLQAIQGVSTDAEVLTADVRRVNKVIRESGVPAVFVETTINPKMLNRIAKDNDIVVGGSLFSDSIGDENSAAPSYLEMLRYNTNTIVAALSRKKTTKSEVDDAHNHGGESSGNSTYIMIGLLALVFLGGMAFMIKKMNKA